MHDDVVKLIGNIGGTFLLAILGWMFRRIRKYFRALEYAQKDISTIWVHLDLPRELRSGSYAREHNYDERGE